MNKVISAPQVNPHVSSPLFCSFYTPGGYYEECASKFKEDAKRLDLQVHIEEFEIPNGQTWPDVCRMKIPFLHRIAKQNPDRRIFWVDIDSRLKSMPEFILNSSSDIIGFQRGFSAPLSIGYANRTRFWEPSFLGVGTSAAARNFLETAAAIEKESNFKATDDYFFEEAWRREAANLSFQIIPSRLSKIGLDQFFVFGSSSNVQTFRGSVRQHKSPIKKTRVTNQLKESLRNALPPATLHLYRKIKNLSSNVTAQAAAASGPITPQQLTVLVKKEMAYSAAPDREKVKALSARCIENTTPSIYSWGEAFQDYRLPFNDNAPLDLMWWDRPAPGNFGDWLSPYIVRKISNRPIRYIRPDTSPKAPYFLGVGSIARFATANATILGAGVAATNTIIDPRARFAFVRGPYTAKCIISQGGSVQTDVMGDMAVLMPRLYQPTPIENDIPVALVRHFSHRNLPLALPEGIEEIDIWGARPKELEHFIDRITGKAKVLTSAMHCHIICQSYGIPSALITFIGGEDDVSGDGIKYRDYAAGVGLPELSPIAMPTDLRHSTIDNIITADAVSSEHINTLMECATNYVHAATAEWQASDA